MTQMVKNLIYLPMQETGDAGSVPGLGRSPGGGHSNPLQHSGLENLMDRQARQAMIHSVSKSGTCLENSHGLLSFSWTPARGAWQAAVHSSLTHKESDTTECLTLLLLLLL